MDQSAFYGVVSAINFTLLGQWWVAVKDLRSSVEETASTRRTAYLVSLQFVIPGTVALLAQVSPEVAQVWRTAFAVAGIVGVVSVVMLANELRRTSSGHLIPDLFVGLGVPLYVAVVAVAVLPLAGLLPASFTPIQAEAVLITLLVVLGVQEAWAVSMTAKQEPTAKSD